MSVNLTLDKTQVSVDFKKRKSNGALTIFGHFKCCCQKSAKRQFDLWRPEK
jgi:hypothetical protein